eukprot:TRINITY_DN9156_c0_g1_i1.p1 TRINITY_DN9156_c0_g1~~TRINITY_DN9156_c0_g1_i1.p1  ORF type:complete len:213 (-),score=7.23 TRINITY_DN9156_c0_g1_i1:221-859(-)
MVTALFLVNASQGIYAAYRRRSCTEITEEQRAGLKGDHVKFMLQASLASLNAALMRVCILPLVLLTSALWTDGEGGTTREWLWSRIVHQDARGWVGIGEWLWAKELAYTIQAIVLLIPYLVPAWSPYATETMALLRSRESRGALAKARAIAMATLLMYLICATLNDMARSYRYMTQIGFRGGLHGCKDCLCHIHMSRAPCVDSPITSLGLDL